MKTTALIRVFSIVILSSVLLLSNGKAQGPEVEIRQVKMLDDGTAALKISVNYRNQTEKPFIFSYFNRPDQILVQQTGFVTKIHLEEYEGNLEAINHCGEWNDETVSVLAESGQLSQLHIPPGDMLFAEYVYRVDPENGFEVILPSGNTLPFTQLISHLSMSFGDAKAFQEMIPTEVVPCGKVRSHSELRADDLEQLRQRIHNLQTRLLKLGQDAAHSYI